MKTGRSAALKFIFITILVDVIGWGLIIPVMPNLISELVHIPPGETSQYGGWLVTVYALMQFMIAPLLGALSDKYGRRPVLLFSLFGFGIDYLFMAFAPTYAWLFVGRVISGITGASFTTASAYIADISDADNRAKNFGMIGAAFGLGFIIGPVIGGLLGEFGSRAPFYAAAVLCLVNWLYGYFVLPESLDKAHRREFDWKRAYPSGALMQLKKYPGISGLVFSMVLVYIASHAVQSNWNYFTVYKFNWSKKMIGFSLGVVGVLVALVQTWLMGKVHPVLGNTRSIYIGLLLYSAGMFLFAFATESWMMFVFLVPYCLGGIAGPALQATISSHVPPNAQGELQGILTSLMSLTSIVGPLLMTQLFNYFTKKSAPIQFAGAPFVLGGALMLLSALFAYRSLYNEKQIIQTSK
jgi:DHA1 family tetracycline resistance protein-like MFS transporter